MPNEVVLLTIEHRHGVEHRVCDTEETARMHLLAYVCDWWEKEIRDTPIPKDVGECISEYFERVEDEFYSIETLPILDSVMVGEEPNVTV